MRRTVCISVTRFDANSRAECADEVAAEEPLEIRVAGEVVSVTMRTPGDDMELAAGFLFTEGFLRAGETPVMRQTHPNVVEVSKAGISPVSLEKNARSFAMVSSCGLCGKRSIAAVHQHFPAIETEGLRVRRSVLQEMAGRLGSIQPAFAQTGGMHAAAAYDLSGQLIVAREDIGRHNAVDKVIGHGLLRKGLPWTSAVLLVSGRASFEIMQKALAARISTVAAVSAPSSLAVQFADESGQTLIGFLRPERMNVYSHSHRIDPT